MENTKKEKRRSKKVNLNLGCGNHILESNKDEEWINVDNYLIFSGEENKKFVQADIRTLPFEKESADYILCDNVLEHIAMSDIPIVLQEMRRVLKVGGRAVIIVPDFRDALEQWSKMNHDESFNPFFYQYLSEVIYGLQTHQGEYHRTPFCPGFMNYSLQMVGLRKYRLVMHPAFSEYPNYPGVFMRPEAKCRSAVLVADIIKE